MKQKLIALIMFVTFAVPTGTALLMATPAAAASCPSDNLFGIPAWYSGLQDTTTCNVIFPSSKSNSSALQNFVIKVALNAISAILVIAGYVALFFVIKGGFLYVIARGDTGNIATAKQTITNAIIGLIISLLSAAIVMAVSGAIHT